MSCIEDFEYDYDGLDRLIESRRGDASGTFAPVPYSSRFTPSIAFDLDLLGNWRQMITDKDADGPDGDGTDVPETREHNDANELTERDPDGAGVKTPYDLVHDRNGNLQTQEVTATTTVTYTHDAWDRLVKVEYGTDTRAEFSYNGLNWRVLRKADTDADGTLDQQRLMLHSAAWQLLEERIDDAAPFSLDPAVFQPTAPRFKRASACAPSPTMTLSGSGSCAHTRTRGCHRLRRFHPRLLTIRPSAWKEDTKEGRQEGTKARRHEGGATASLRRRPRR